MMEEPAIAAHLATRHTPFRWLHILESLYLPKIIQEPARLAAFNQLLFDVVGGVKLCGLPSQGCCEDLVAHFGASAAQKTAIPSPLDPSRSVDRSAEPLDDFGETPLFVRVGRLGPQKDHRLLLDACALLMRRLPKFHVLIRGDGSERPSLEAQVRELT